MKVENRTKGGQLMAEQKLSNEELAELLRQGQIAAFNAYREQFPNQEIDFSGRDFSGLELVEANLECPKELDGADFSKSNLYKAGFCAAEGRNVCFREANCEVASFNEVEFPDAIFIEAQCAETSFIDAELDGASFKNANCAAAVFTDTSLRVANFENADLAEACLAGTTLDQANFKDAYIETANFAKARGLSKELSLQIIKNLLEGWEEKDE